MTICNSQIFAYLLMVPSIPISQVTVVTKVGRIKVGVTISVGFAVTHVAVAVVVHVGISVLPQCSEITQVLVCIQGHTVS
jgi:hypothetical protein